MGVADNDSRPEGELTYGDRTACGKRGLSVLEARADGFPGHTREVCHGFEANMHKLYTVG